MPLSLVKKKLTGASPVFMIVLGMTGVEKDTAKAIRHYEAAAMRGHVDARFNLGWEESNVGNFDLALQHWIIAAKLGDEGSLDKIKKMFVNGHATKAEYAGALRGCQSAVEEMTSPDRDEALALGLHIGSQDDYFDKMKAVVPS